MDFLKKIFSMRTMGLLMLLFGVAIGIATFIENDYGTPSAQAVIYNALWFEVVLGLLVVNLFVTIFTYKLYRKEKIVTLIFHLSFVLVLIGAGITRFIGFEGMMHIREGEASNVFVTTDTYVSIDISGQGTAASVDDKVIFSELGEKLRESAGLDFGGINYNNTLQISNKEINVKLEDFIPDVERQIMDAEDGGPILTLVTAGEDGRINNFLTEKRTQNFGGLYFHLNDTTVQSDIYIMESDSGLVLKSPLAARFMRMSDQSFGEIKPGEWTRLLPRQLYVIGSSNFVLQDYREKAKLVLKQSETPNSDLPDLARFSVSDGETEQFVEVTGGRGISQNRAVVKIGEFDVSVGYGSIMRQLPFQIALEDFQLERYPGSESPSSFASEVTLIDEAMNLEKPYRVYMNNILEHRGFRFYQSSYDNDELGTVLSVNHDYWGTFVTYWGYFFLFAGLLMVFFSRNTRFAQLSKMISQIHKKRAAGIGAVLLAMLLYAPSLSAQEQDSDPAPPAPSEEHSRAFSRLLIQTQDGRITPINTVGNEILRKVIKKENYKGLNSDQVFLGMISHPLDWRDEKMIRVNHEEVADLVGAEGKYASFLDFFSEDGDYKLQDAVEEAFARKPAERNKMDKELIAVDERVNICYMAYFGSFLKLFPIPGHPDNKWTTPVEPINAMDRMDSLYVTGVLAVYYDALQEGMDTGNYEGAEKILSSIDIYQEKFGGEVLPSETRVELELLYNDINIFERLYPIYMLVGFVFLILLYVRLLRPATPLKWGIKSVEFLVFVLFGIHAVGLGLRWYISGHEPWSNGYESMLYIAWANLLAGIIFSKKSPVTLAVTAILAGIILFVAHLSWMDPEITNLVPVLKSYWLTIHVATITASYGFLALGALLAFVNLVTMLMRRKSNRLRLNLTIKEVTYVIEMTLTVGLVMLTIGNFLGGIWANESWGRYWGWDPKETWAMATIIFYAFVLHMRFIPGLRGAYAFNLGALVTFSSVIMTYFGVNYYLSGLHSYAKGDPVPIPDFVPWTIAVIGLIALLAFINDKIDRKSKNDSGNKPSSPGSTGNGPKGPSVQSPDQPKPELQEVDEV